MGKPAAIIEYIINLRKQGDDAYYTQRELLTKLRDDGFVISQAYLSVILDACLTIGAFELQPRTTIVSKWKYRARLN